MDIREFVFWTNLDLFSIVWAGAITDRGYTTDGEGFTDKP